jgi:YD repeat-containing protein
MKSTFIFIAGFIVGYVFTITGCNAQTTYLYGAQGQSLGTIQQSGNTQYFYGPQGESRGTAMQSGNTTYVYGSQGQSVGTVMSPSIPMVYTTPTYNPSSLTPVYDSIFGR